jgi:hypothetical protein
MQSLYLKSSKEHKRTSRYRGVNWDKRYNAWRARIGVQGVTKCLGYFSDELEAAKAYNAAAVKYRKDVLNVLPTAA